MAFFDTIKELSQITDHFLPKRDYQRILDRLPRYFCQNRAKRSGLEMVPISFELL